MRECGKVSVRGCGKALGKHGASNLALPPLSGSERLTCPFHTARCEP